MCVCVCVVVVVVVVVLPFLFERGGFGGLGRDSSKNAVANTKCLLYKVSHVGVTIR